MLRPVGMEGMSARLHRHRSQAKMHLAFVFPNVTLTRDVGRFKNSFLTVQHSNVAILISSRLVVRVLGGKRGAGCPGESHPTKGGG